MMARVSWWGVVVMVAVIGFWSGLSDAALLKEYDLLVANGNNIIFFQNSSNSSVGVPVIPKDQRTRIKWIASDIQNDTIFFTSVKAKAGVSISSYNLRTNQTTEIYSINGTRAVVEGLSLYGNHLYWSNRPNLTIMRLEIARLDENQKRKVPEIVFTDQDSTMESFAINPVDGSIYYTNWRKGQQAEILLYTGLRNGSLGHDERHVFAQNLSQPYALYSDATHLYYAANLPGVYYSIERINLEEPDKIQVLHKSSGRHPLSLAVNCSQSIFFTDVRNKVLWKFNIRNNNLTKVKYFREDFPPSGLALISPSPLICQFARTQEEGQENSSSSRGSACSGQECDSISPITSSENNAKDCEIHHTTAISSLTSSTLPTSKVLVENCTSQENKCLNEASCLKINGRIFCLFQEAAVDSKLYKEKNLTEEAAVPVMSSPSNSKDHLHNQSSSFLSSWSSSTDPFLVCSAVLSVVVILLMIVVVLLVIKVRKLDRKPRIRRRVVVSHRSDIENNPPSVCEMIDIENCCNMNICETPCYERVTGGAGSSSSSGTISFGRSRKNSVKEDKKCLLSS